MVPDIVPPPPPPMPSATYVPSKPALTIVKSEKSASPPRNPIATSDSYDSVIDEIKNKGGTLRKTKRKEVVRVEDCTVPSVNLKSVVTAEPTFKNEIVVNIAPAITINVVNLNGPKSAIDVTDNSTEINGLEEISIGFQLKRPSEFLNGTKPEPLAKKEVLKPQLAPKVSVNGTKQVIKLMTNGTTTSISTNKTFDSQKEVPQRKPSLVSTTIQRLTSTEPESPTKAKTSPFKRNQALTRSISGGISNTIQKLERRTSESNSPPPSFQRSNSVRQRNNQMHQVEKPKQTIKDGTQTVGWRQTAPRPKLPRPSNGTLKFLSELNNPPRGKVPFPSQNGNMRLENEEARVGTVVNVADLKSTVAANDPTVKKLVYGTYRNFLGAYNSKANNVVTNQNDTMVVQDRGVAERLGKIAINGNVSNLTGRAVQKTED